MKSELPALPEGQRWIEASEVEVGMTLAAGAQVVKIEPKKVQIWITALGETPFGWQKRTFRLRRGDHLAIRG